MYLLIQDVRVDSFTEHDVRVKELFRKTHLRHYTALTYPSTVPMAAAMTPSFAQALAQIQQFEAEQQSFQLQLRTQYMLDALNQFARFLSELPGRKNFIWFSASFPIDILPDGDLADPFAAMADNDDEFRETVTLMARSHVAVFPVDARGLMVNPNLNVENSGAKYAADSTRFDKDTTSFFDQTASEHSTMMQMGPAGKLSSIPTASKSCRRGDRLRRQLLHARVLSGRAQMAEQSSLHFDQAQ